MKPLHVLSVILMVMAISCSGDSGPAPLRIVLHHVDPATADVSINDRPVGAYHLEGILERLARIDSRQRILVVVESNVNASAFISLMSMLDEKGFSSVTVYPVQRLPDWRIATGATFSISTPEPDYAVEPHDRGPDELVDISFKSSTLIIRDEDGAYTYRISPATKSSQFSIDPPLLGLAVREYDYRVLHTRDSTTDLSVLRLRTQAGHYVTLRDGDFRQITRRQLGQLPYFGGLKGIEPSNGGYVWEKKPQVTIRFRDREAVAAEFLEYEWENMVSSKDDDQVRQAFRFLGQFSSAELHAHQDIWVPALRALLQSDNPEHRLRAASRLHSIQDPAAIPVLIDGFRYESEIPFKRSLLNQLQRTTGQDFPFDPTAPEDVREEQIRVWEDWWAEQVQEEQ